jgi:muramoyltetrapeptide carboxypeptidase
MKTPPPLHPGQTIGIVCPAGYMPAEKAENCIRTLKKWGYRVAKGKTLGGRSKNYFSGSDEERLMDLQEMLDNPEIHAVLCGRGGYGTTRILDQINWKAFKKKPKWIVGFSDLTILHGFMHQQLQIASIHGPMAGAFNQDEGENRFILSLKDTLEGKPTCYTAPHHPFNTSGKAKGQLIGGNLCIMAHALGSNAAYHTDGKILFLEDVGEQLYNIDRMMLQLKRGGLFKRLKGLIVGGFTDNKDTERPFGQTAYAIINEHVKEYKYPKCYGFPVSHERENVAIAIGCNYQMTVDADGIVLTNQVF